MHAIPSGYCRLLFVGCTVRQRRSTSSIASKFYLDIGSAENFHLLSCRFFLLFLDIQCRFVRNNLITLARDTDSFFFVSWSFLLIYLSKI